MRLYYVQTVRTYCTTNSMLHHQLLLTAVSLLQLMVTGGFHSARMNTVLSVNQVSDRLRRKNIGFIPHSTVSVNVHCINGLSLCV